MSDWRRFQLIIELHIKLIYQPGAIGVLIELSYTNDMKTSKANSFHSNRIRIIKTFAIIIVLLLVIVATYIFATMQSSNNKSLDGNSKKTNVSSYKFETLGKSCSDGIVAYDTKIDSLNQKMTETSTTANAQYKSISDAATAYQASQQASYNKAYSDATKSYNSGLISVDEYFRETNALKPIADSIVASANSTPQQIATLSQTYAPIIQQQKSDLEKMKDERSKLQTCVDTAKTHGDFSVSDVANFESIISKQ